MRSEVRALVGYRLRSSEAVEKLLKARKLTRKELAGRIRVTPSMVTQMLNHGKTCTSETAGAFAGALGTKVNYLFIPVGLVVLNEDGRTSPKAASKIRSGV